MNSNLSLTANEAAFLVICLNYDSVEGQLSDNYSNGGIAEAMDLFNGDRKAAGGLMTSLTNKGLGDHDIEHDMFCLSEAGVHAAFAVKNGTAKVTAATVKKIKPVAGRSFYEGPMSKHPNMKTRMLWVRSHKAKKN